jgi:hypothetical protein
MPPTPAKLRKDLHETIVHLFVSASALWGANIRRKHASRKKPWISLIQAVTEKRLAKGPVISVPTIEREAIAVARGQRVDRIRSAGA